jgi:uncharacterized damage-inducible protein DinB
MRTALFAAALLAAPAALAAQEMRHEAHRSAGVEAIQPLYDRIKDLYLRSAEAMPEEHYHFRPVDGVRTFMELLGHVANENYLFCANALGEPDPNTTDFEKSASKAALIAGLKASFAYCDPAYRMSPMKAAEETTFFGNAGSRLWVLIFNVTHDSEHYGNLVTYLRMKGIVPPSSQGGD